MDQRRQGWAGGSVEERAAWDDFVRDYSAALRRANPALPATDVLGEAVTMANRMVAERRRAFPPGPGPAPARAFPPKE